MGSFIYDFEALQATMRCSRLRRMESFLSSFREHHRQVRARSSSEFNTFSLLGIGMDEVRQSKFLAWLLDAEADHRQGNAFIRAFVGICGLDVPLDVLDDYRVLREFSGAESIVDIAVFRRNSFLIYLENKILAQEGPHQIDREFRDMRRLGVVLRIPEQRQFGIFLTPDGQRPVSGEAIHWKPISYRELGAGFERLLSGVASVKVTFILRDWIDTISTFGESYGNVL